MKKILIFLAGGVILAGALGQGNGGGFGGSKPGGGSGASLPAQATHAGQFLKTDGSSASWGAVPLSTGISGFGSGIATALGINTGLSGAPVLFNGTGGTPSSINLQNGGSLPVSGLSGLGTGVQTGLGQALNTSSGFASSNAPTFSGIVTMGSGAAVRTANAMGALAIDVTKMDNSKSVSADTAFTFSGTPATAGTYFGIWITNSGGTARTMTIPSSFSVGQNGAITTTTLPASGYLWLVWYYDGSIYRLTGDPPATSGTGSFLLTSGGTASVRLTPRVTTIVSSATPTINTDNCDCVTITALAAAITSMTTNLSGTPVNFDQLELRIKDDGTARAISRGASFVSGVGTMATTTIVGKPLHEYYEWDSVQSKWVCAASGSEP